MTYHDPRLPFVNLWFSSPDGRERMRMRLSTRWTLERLRDRRRASRRRWV